jgi:Putative abortive phage resistance protein AbiGi, antitoxin
VSNRYISNELFHFVGRSDPTNHEANYQVLLKVLDARCVSHPPHTHGHSAHRLVINWDKNVFSEKLVMADITCFCDIPLETLGIHMKKYGMFGVSFDRSLLIKNGARPVTYMPLQPSNPYAGWGTIYCELMLHDVEQIWRGFREHVVDPIAGNSRTRSLGAKPTSSNEAATAMDDVFTHHFMAFIKPFNSELPDDHPDNFYFEREWRKLGNLPFQPSEVLRVLVARDYAERLKDERPSYADKITIAPE